MAIQLNFAHLFIQALRIKADSEMSVVLDLDSSVARIANKYISMTLSDIPNIYAVNSNYRLKILTRDSQGDVVLAASTGKKFRVVITTFIYVSYFI